VRLSSVPVQSSTGLFVVWFYSPVNVTLKSGADSLLNRDCTVRSALVEVFFDCSSVIAESKFVLCSVRLWVERGGVQSKDRSVYLSRWLQAGRTQLSAT